MLMKFLFFRYVEVTDIARKKKYQFLARRWLSAHKFDGRVDCVIPLAKEAIELKRFSYVFTENTQMSLHDGHLWWSLLLRPPASSFTRCQRLSVVFTALMCSMTASAMFYDSLPTRSTAYENGAFNVTIGLQQVKLGL